MANCWIFGTSSDTVLEDGEVMEDGELTSHFPLPGRFLGSFDPNIDADGYVMVLEHGEVLKVGEVLNVGELTPHFFSRAATSRPQLPKREERSRAEATQDAIPFLGEFRSQYRRRWLCHGEVLEDGEVLKVGELTSHFLSRSVTSRPQYPKREERRRAEPTQDAIPFVCRAVAVYRWVTTDSHLTSTSRVGILFRSDSPLGGGRRLRADGEPRANAKAKLAHAMRASMKSRKRSA